MASSIRVGIISIGEMGLGVSKLLRASSVPVTTCLAKRSAATRQRAKSAGIEAFDDYEAFVDASDVILSIVPPRDALETADIIVRAVNSGELRSGSARMIHYMDLNAVSTETAVKIAGVIAHSRTEHRAPTREIRYIDGGIIGPPPKQSEADPNSWTKPSIVVSGPHALDDVSAPPWGKQLMSILNMRHISPVIGQASGLKMCFASLTKGFTSIAIQSYTTAHRLGVLPELQKHLDLYSPASKSLAERSLVSMPPKAYRWVNEMEEISQTFAVEGGFDQRMFDAVAQVYRSVADETVLGEEKTGDRKRGLTAEDVAEAMGEGLASKARQKGSAQSHR